MVAPPRRAVAILGSTGSIGTQALDVIERHPERFRVVALAAGRRASVLAEQARRFRPALVSCADESDAARLRTELAETQVVPGAAGLVAVAVESGADVVLAATDGAVAFEAIFAAVEHGLTVAIANKEVIVAAGELLFAEARKSGASILPVDSEHSALFQCLQGERRDRIAMLVLTASGGPFWELSEHEMHRARLADALRHPTWNMGTKNTVDSATMMNKGLEVIEASRFFGVPADRIEVLIHRTSVGHGFAIFSDGSIKGQFSLPDMRGPIGYALAYPDRLVEPRQLDPLMALGGRVGEDVTALRFERPDRRRFPCLQLAYDALSAGGTAPASLSAANEVAVRAFADGRIAFGEIAEVVKAALAAAAPRALSLEGVREADAQGRVLAQRAIAETKSSTGVV
ncbi:MAG: 1-deoxy-D-xylulose-5-phosphate reductoisomerase [Candidatus Eremiobacteraeota bacterium]|nr:1-deoxy-D-xylulose-5-phosphate reductoisomerase [Candidatus Eremiobacteraeota bacterium]MBV9646651.1 1-deoxy-D-xylulose-5-phosphate reductoisomerase [Candidatus Eremiobacteraeota bacterium]